MLDIFIGSLVSFFLTGITCALATFFNIDKGTLILFLLILGIILITRQLHAEALKVLRYEIEKLRILGSMLTLISEIHKSANVR